MITIVGILKINDHNTDLIIKFYLQTELNIHKHFI